MREASFFLWTSSPESSGSAYKKKLSLHIYQQKEKR